MLDNPFAIPPLFKLFAALPQTPQNITIVLDIDNLTLKDEFMVHNPLDVKENQQHALGCTPDLTCFCDLGDYRLFHCKESCPSRPRSFDPH